MFDRWLDRYRWYACALSGVLLVLGFAPFSAAPLGWVSLVPAWWVISHSEQVRRQPLRYGYLVGLIYMGGCFWWISNVTMIGTFFLVLYLALYPALWFLLVARLIPRRAEGTSLVLARDAVCAASLWVTLEWWRSWFLTGFNWNELGITQSDSIVYRQIAAFAGVHGLSFLLVAVNVLWAEGLIAMWESIFENRSVRGAPCFHIALLIVAITFGIGWQHLQRHRGESPGPPVTFACIQPNIPQIPYDHSTPYSNFQLSEQAALDKTEKLTLTAIAVPEKPQLLLWPEATISEGVFNDRPLNEAVHDITRAFDGYFLLGSQDFEVIPRSTENPKGGGRIYNVAYFFTPHGDQYDEYRKTRLVILGEFLPFSSEWLRSEVGIGMDFTPGPGPRVFTMKEPALKIAPLICFEDTLPEVADKAAPLGPDFFVTITNDGWYTGWCAAWGIRQHLAHAVFRCVEHDRPMIRCANNGISCLIDPNGTVVDRFRDAAGRVIDVGGIFAGKLAVLPIHATLHEEWGDWIVLISGVVSAMLGVRLFRRS